MSVVTFPQVPQTYTPSDNPITWVLAFPKTGAYRLNFEIAVNGTFGSGVILNVEAETEDATYYYAHVDVSNIIKTYVNKAQTTQTSIVGNANNYEEVYLIVGVNYATTPTGTITFDVSSVATSSTIYAFKSCLSNSEFKNWSYTDYMIGASNSKFLTDNTNTTELRVGDETYLQIIEGTYAYDYLVDITLYDATGTIVNNDTISVAHGTNKILQLKFTTTLLTALFSSYDVIASSYFSVYIRKTFVPITETKRININRETCYNGKNLVWLNKFGAYDSFLFTYNNILKSDVNSKSYGKKFGEWNGVTYEYDTKDTGSLTYLKTITDKIQIVSDWLTQAEQNFLVQIYESPLVYINEANQYENIEIENSSYQFKQAEHEELFNEIIDAKFTHSRKSINI